MRRAHVDRGTTSTAAAFRGDVNGLRSFAIIPVVLMHAGLSTVPGGFVGVDVFFVISGFLITGHLFREAESGRLNVLAFWARRLRRLYPTLALVVVATMGLALVIMSPLELPSLAVEAGATMLSVSNLLFAREATDYFGHDVQQSPLLHTWSLGVEEQFYVILPLVIIAMLKLGDRNRRVRLIRFLAVGAALSFATSLVATSLFPFWSFYSLPTRVWEFAIGGLIALGAERLRIIALVKNAIVWLGMGLILLSVLTITSSSPFPGSIALVPVIGTGLVIVGGTQEGTGSKLLATRPLQWIGTRSYAWYLWHWPLMVFGRIVFDSDSVWLGLGAGALSLLLAAITYRHFELPLRTTPRLTRSVGDTYRFMASIGTVSLVLAASLGMFGDARSGTPSTRVWASVYQQGAPRTCDTPVLTPSGLSYCVAGDASEHDTVLLVGDSHAGQWVRLLDRLGARDGYRLVVRSLDACPAAVVSVTVRAGGQSSRCDAFHAETAKLIDELQPSVVVTASSNSYLGMIVDPTGRVPSPESQAAMWADGYRSIIANAQSAGATVVAIEDTYRPGGDPAVCMTRPFGGVERCEPDRDAALEPVALLLAAERRVQQAMGVETLSFIDRLCDEVKCPVVDSGIPIFADVSHISPAWAERQASRVRALIGSV